MSAAATATGAAHASSASTARFVRLASALPWLLGIAGALLFLRALWPAPATTLVERVFWYDGLINVDALAALHRNLTEGPAGRGFHDWIYAGRFFFPQPRPLVTSELLPLAALVTWPLRENPVLAHNVALAAALVLDVVAGAAFARAAGARPVAAAAAGVAFTFSAYTNFSSGRVQLVCLFPAAFAFASTLRWTREGRTADAARASAWVLVQALLCLYYALFLAILLPAAAFAGRVASRRPGAVRELATLAGMLALGLAPAIALLVPYRELRSSLGLVRKYAEVVEQSGDPRMFLWADASTPWGGVLPDLHRWDTAYFPGAMVLVAAFVALVGWVRRDWRGRRAIVLLPAAGFALSFALGFVCFLAGGAAALLLLVRRAREGRVSTLAPVLATIVFVSLVLFFGPEPKAFQVRLGWSPYEWLYHHAPFLDGLRVARRAGVFVNLAICALAAIALSRLELRRRGAALVALAAIVALVEGLPSGLGTVRIATRCEDAALAAAKRLGADAVGELFPKQPAHPLLAQHRHHATMCDVSTNLGPAGFVPRVTDVANDALESLPDAAAHARLWDAGIRHVVLRSGGVPSWPRERAARLERIAASRETIGSDIVLALKPPAHAATPPESRLEGPRVAIRSATCSVGQGCGAATDGDPATRWTSHAAMSGGESVELRFDRARVGGFVWRAGASFADLPRGLEIQAETAPGEWQPWASFPAISFLPLGRNAVDVRLALSLPARETGAIRIVQTGASTQHWLSAGEVEIVAAE